MMKFFIDLAKRTKALHTSIKGRKLIGNDLTRPRLGASLASAIVSEPRGRIPPGTKQPSTFNTNLLPTTF